MPRFKKNPDYSDAGITLMSQVFEHQMRIAQILGAAAFSGNPFFMRPAVPRAKERAMPCKAEGARDAVKHSRSMPV
ncbi:hypothetical protein [Roseovarius aquimarinus]|uniref:Uncharacterized protein n=1 Tax=Roseovarius aquimarinus TaxID=1229156 RepID=A0ABW7I8D0_9RHOB